MFFVFVACQMCATWTEDHKLTKFITDNICHLTYLLSHSIKTTPTIKSGFEPLMENGKPTGLRYLIFGNGASQSF